MFAFALLLSRMQPICLSSLCITSAMLLDRCSSCRAQHWEARGGRGRNLRAVGLLPSSMQPMCLSSLRITVCCVLYRCGSSRTKQRDVEVDLEEVYLQLDPLHPERSAAAYSIHTPS